MKKSSIVTIFIILLSFSSLAFSATWDKGGMNDPSYFKLATSTFDKLPLSGRVKNLPMTSAHWLHKNGGISWQYQIQGKSKPLLTKKEVLRGLDTIELSPAEKYDIARGDYSFSLTKQERISQKNYKYEWEGHCHGWVVASLKYPISKTKNITIINKDGVEIVFYPQDIMAILSYFEGVKQTSWDYWAIEHKIPWYMDSKGFTKDSQRIQELIKSLQNKRLRKKITKLYDKAQQEDNFRKGLMKQVVSYKNDFYTPYIGIKNKKDERNETKMNEK